MNEQDVRLLLAVAMAYDNRKPGDANVKAWQEAATRGRWTVESAAEAIHQHYAVSRDFLMPADVTARVRALREEIPPRYVPALPEAPDPEAPFRHKQIVRSITGDPPEEAQREARARGQHCSHCHASPGRPCTTNGHPRKTSHPSRLEAAFRQESA